VPKKTTKQKGRKLADGKLETAKAKSPQASPREPDPVAETNRPKPLEVLKQNLSRIGKGSLFYMLNEIRNTTPEQWQDPETVKAMAKRFADQFKIPVSEDRLNAFVNAFQDATRPGAKSNVDDIVKKYGGSQVDEETLKEMKKFLK
jgi:uncharacterized protein YpuA (DUF1002 family)